MSDSVAPKLSKWPFFTGDAILLGTAYFINSQSQRPLTQVEMMLIAACVALGAVLSVLPFALEYRATVKVAEAGALTNVVSQITELNSIAGQISNATGRWQTVQDEADKTAAAAKAIAERMGAEVKAFTDFLQKVNDTERTTLRLEVEKLRRGENDWLQVLIRMLDHVYALYSGALRSGQPNLIEQLTHFQNACRDSARRVGLLPFLPAPSERFDAQRHQVLDGNGTPGEGATVSETVATGYTFQGRLLRPALVKLQGATKSEAGTQPVALPGGGSAPTPEKKAPSQENLL